MVSKEENGKVAFAWKRLFVVFEDPYISGFYVRSGKVRIIIGEEYEELTIEQLAFMCDILKHEIIKYHEKMKEMIEKEDDEDDLVGYV